MQNDYIKLYRKLLNWEWYKNTNTKVLFIHCLLKANWKEGQFEGREIKRGEFVTSLPILSQETGLTVREVRTALKHLKTTHEVTCTTTSKYTVITVLNYDLYQASDMQSDRQVTGNRQASDRQVTGNRQASDRQVTTIEERKKERKKETKEGKKEKKKEIIYNTEYTQIIDYLNSKCGTNYRSGSASTQRLINARLNEGYTVEDFYTVIDKKWEEWAGTEWEQYMRPSTLFSPKFESYLNQNTIRKNNNNSYLEAAQKKEQEYDDFLMECLERHNAREAYKQGGLKEYEI